MSDKDGSPYLDAYGGFNPWLLTVAPSGLIPVPESDLGGLAPRHTPRWLLKCPHLELGPAAAAQRFPFRQQGANLVPPDCLQPRAVELRHHEVTVPDLRLPAEHLTQAPVEAFQQPHHV